MSTRTARVFAAGMLVLLVSLALVAPRAADADVAVSITIAPPVLPVYEQPPIPAAGYIWTPGYWAYGPDGYFWVPGTWVEPPAVGLLWTPGYWAWSNGVFIWNAGFWGPQIGFYGGVNYGFGYPGRGYEGGYWRGNEFYYNRTVTNITNVQIRNVYTQNITNVTVNKTSYVGGSGGLTARPTAQEQRAMDTPHRPPTAAQNEQRATAHAQRAQLVSVNHGKPPVAATPRANEFSAHPVAVAVTHASELAKPMPAHAPAASTSAAEQAAARQQADLQARQEQERAALEQQQNKDHASYAQQKNKSDPAFAAMEHQHQQQTQQLQQRQAQERQPEQKPRPQQAHTAPRESAPEHRTGG
jgi:hypothetical protein